MRIQLLNGPNGRTILAPVDPPPTLDIDDLFELTLEASQSTFKPLTNVQIRWTIRPKGASLSDYVFTLRDTYGPIAEDIGASGAATVFAYRNALVRVRARRRGSAALSDFDRTLTLTADTSDCVVVDNLGRFVFDAQFESGVRDLIDEIDRIKLQTRTTVRPGAFPPDILIVEKEIVSTWKPGSIEYDVPLELRVPGPNPDWNVHLKITFSMTHEPEGSQLTVTVTPSDDVSVDTVGGVISAGIPWAIEAVAEPLLDELLKCYAERFERAIVRLLMDYIAARLDGFRLLGVGVRGGNVPAIVFTICPFPVGPLDAPPIVGPGEVGGLIARG